ncbi:MAG: PIG-L family deacetylase [Bryobacteraceae bacterium]|nr:PIG-L family deacetylase [Bryobacteraceae bacterium]
MHRRHFLGSSAAWAAYGAQSEGPGRQYARGAVMGTAGAEELVIERAQTGKPHAGKVLAAIQPHADDIPFFAAGTVAKLIEEGYTGYLIRVTNDDMAGPGTIADTVMANEKDNEELAKTLGLVGAFDLNYNNHRMDEVSPSELRSRFIFLFRLLRVDTIFCYDPWGHYEENPDHYVTALAVESACWMSGGSKDYPEHMAAGLKTKGVAERYYYARGPQLVNRVVDIAPTIETKIDALCVNKAQGPGGDNGIRLRDRLAKQGLRLAILGGDDRTANREYARNFLLRDEEEIGRRHGLKYAEQFHYIGPRPSAVDEYVKQNAQPL